MKIKYDENDQWRLNYHLMPPTGWLGDPNGLCQFKGKVHIFFQYCQSCTKRKKISWGHYSTRDYIHYQWEGIAIKPDSEIDKDGVYSGCSLIKDNKMYLFYTGNIKKEGHYDYIYEGRGQYLNRVESEDGKVFKNKINLLKNKDYPSNMSCHVRDPKIYEENNHYYLTLGARSKNDIPGILIYKSDDLIHFNYLDFIHFDYPFGYMWECPNLFKLDGQKFVLYAPQGLKKAGYHNENIYSNGYSLLEGDMEGKLSLGPFHELDEGFDFYVPQVYQDDKQRTIIIAWMGISDSPYDNPTIQYHWLHALTLPRALRYVNHRLYQYPIEEIKQLRKNHHHCTIKDVYNFHSQSMEIQLKINNQPFIIHFRKDIKLSYDGKILTFSLKASGQGRKARHIEIENIDTMSLFSDRSSLEIFINDGQRTLTSRVYDHKEETLLWVNHPIEADFYELESFIIEADD